ncbi:MAG: TetR/AcrR family transcriptional regulator [Acholeplasmatales bacterium]|nr:TetR/AcrR family transcriptional regulator [Acholeplasmatales bacterium]
MDTKELILLVAKEEFIKKGYDDTSLRDIAKKCHISPTAIYRHFENKEDIFNEIIKPLFDYFDEATIKINFLVSIVPPVNNVNIS